MSVDEIEMKILSGEMKAPAVFTQMKQHIEQQERVNQESNTLIGQLIDQADDYQTEILQLKHELSQANSEASSLALSLWKKYYMKESSNFSLCDSTAGIISQIDNMTAGMSENIEKLNQEVINTSDYNYALDEIDSLKEKLNNKIHVETDLCIAQIKVDAVREAAEATVKLLCTNYLPVIARLATNRFYIELLTYADNLEKADKL